MLSGSSTGENMPLHVSICKETFLLQEFVQTGFAGKLMHRELETSIRSSKFLRRLRFVSQASSRKT
jgi:hypothetical protein